MLVLFIFIIIQWLTSKVITKQEQNKNRGMNKTIKKRMNEWMDGWMDELNKKKGWTNEI